MLEYTEEVRGILSLQLYGAEDCAALIEHAREAAAWTRAEVFVPADDGGYSAAVREERAASVFAPDAGSEVMRVFEAKMGGVVKPLVKRLWGADLPSHSSTHLVRYGPGHYYREHTDVADEEPYRYFSFVCYLNDDFEGGHTAFPGLGHAVAPRRGKAVVFPSPYLHRAEPVTRGEKYVLVSWLTGRLPIRWI